MKGKPFETSGPAPMRQLLAGLRARQGAMLGLLGALVRTESPTTDKAAVDAVGRLVARQWRRLGARVTPIPQRHRGDHLRVELEGTKRGAGQILLVGHMDTVYDVGTLRRMPFRIARGRAYGPGVYDMKGGLVIAISAVEALRRFRLAHSKRIVALWTTDEEMGSETSRRHIEREAQRSDAVFVLEPATGLDGRVKTARKGVGDAEIIVTGRATHAGINPQDGVNAVHELALQIARLIEFNDLRRGITVNADVVEGGTRSNVIAERARALVDLRVVRLADAAKLGRKLRALRPILKGAKVEVLGGINRPPMERTPGVVALYKKARAIAAEMGMELGESSTGGGSDGNFTGALGIPTLDGLGAAGEGAHASHENIVIRSLPERAALVAGLLTRL